MASTVSICIPAYARPKLLRAAMESVLTQERGDLELLIGDDSGDLEAVVTSFDDPRVRYRRNASRLGMAGNWTALLDKRARSFRRAPHG